MSGYNKIIKIIFKVITYVKSLVKIYVVRHIRHKFVCLTENVKVFAVYEFFRLTPHTNIGHEGFCASEWIHYYNIILVLTYLRVFRVCLPQFYRYRFIKLISLSFNKLNYVSCNCATRLWSPIRLYVFRILVSKKQRIPGSN